MAKVDRKEKLGTLVLYHNVVHEAWIILEVNRNHCTKYTYLSELKVRTCNYKLGESYTNRFTYVNLAMIKLLFGVDLC